MTSIIPEYTLREQDVEHIERLRELRDSGADMEELKDPDKLKEALLDYFGDPEASETHRWATKEHIPMYQDGAWEVEGILDAEFPLNFSVKYGDTPL